MQYVNNPRQSFTSLDFTKEQARFHMQMQKIWNLTYCRIWYNNWQTIMMFVHQGRL